MSDGILTRRGGGYTLQTLAPTITKVSETTDSITFTIINNDVETAVILYETGDTTPDANSIELAASATSSSLTISDLNRSSALTLYATANVTGKIKSNVVEEEYDAITFTAATGGTTAEYDDGGKRYKSHTFTSNGTFEVTTVGDADGDLNKVDYLIIAGGGGGGNLGGGGGAGGYRTTIGTQGGLGTLDSKSTVTATTFAVVIGAGGAGGAADAVRGASGVNSSALGQTSTGGGGGGGNSGTPLSGGSGGGGGSGQVLNGAGTANQGFSGGNGFSSEPFPSGGGGGAGVVGGTGSGQISGNGGNGLENLLRTGSNETRAGGGGGGARSGLASTQGTGGTGGGGDGGRDTPTAGTANTGGGGGGGGFNGSILFNGEAGGSGIVIIRYEIAPSV